MHCAMISPKAKLIWVDFILEEIVKKTVKNFRENRGFQFWSQVKGNF